MENINTLSISASVTAASAPAMFHALDDKDKEHRTIKDFMTATSAGLTTPHFLPVLYFFDDEKIGTFGPTKFDSTHSRLLSRVEFMPLADLVAWE